MGALCGKQSQDDNFAGAGRTLSAAPAQPASAPLPANRRVIGGPARTLGGGGGGGASASDAGDPREAARRAAEERDKAAKAKAGKLGQQLRQQKALTDNEVNRKANEDEAQRKLIDQNTKALSYD